MDRFLDTNYGQVLRDYLWTGFKRLIMDRFKRLIMDRFKETNYRQV